MNLALFSSAAPSSSEGLDNARSLALIKAVTAFFIAKTPHTQREIDLYEDLALQFLKTALPHERRLLAELLAPHATTPRSVVEALMHDIPDIAAPILKDTPHIAETSLLALALTGSAEHMRLIARRTPLPVPVAEALARRLPAEDFLLLLDNPTLRMTPLLLAEACRMARTHPPIAKALARRHADVEDSDLTDLFLDLDRRGRQRVIHALEILALREFAAGRPVPPQPYAGEDILASLESAASVYDLPTIARHMGSLLQLDATLCLRLLHDPGGEPLAIALKAAGLASPLAMRIISSSGKEATRIDSDAKRLIALNQDVSYRSAAFLVGRWRGIITPLPRREPRATKSSANGSIPKAIAVP